MSENSKEKAILQQESKNDIQELFNELFVNNLRKKIDDASESIIDNAEEVKKEIKKEVEKQIDCCSGDIEELKNALECITADWGDNTLVETINLMSEANKNSEKNIICEIKKFIREVENETIKNGFDKIYNEVKYIQAINDSINVISDQEKFLTAAFEDNGLITQLCNEQKKSSQTLVTYKKQIDDLDQQLDFVNTSIKQMSNEVAENFEIQKDEILTLNKTLQMDYKTQLEKAEDFVIQNTKRFMYVVAGMGFLAIMNIVMFVMLLLG